MKKAQSKQLALSQLIKINVQTLYIPDNNILGQPQNKNYFRYTIKIENTGKNSVQLISRYWLIINDNGEEIEVHGQGVLGKHPVIEAKKSFEYQSFSSIDSDWGSMEGHYTMIDLETEEIFTVKIDRFYLVKDTTIHSQ